MPTSTIAKFLLRQMAAATIQVERAAVVDIPTTVLLPRFRVNSAWLVLGGPAAGAVLSYVFR